ncbi:hypothetical protein D3C80_1468790 [compost metagenome]
MEPSRIKASLITFDRKSLPTLISRNCLTFSISSGPNPSLSFNDLSPSKGAFITRSNEMPGLSGTSFAMAFESGSGRSSALATSLILILAAIEP